MVVCNVIAFSPGINPVSVDSSLGRGVNEVDGVFIARGVAIIFVYLVSLC